MVGEHFPATEISQSVGTDLLSMVSDSGRLDRKWVDNSQLLGKGQRICQISGDFLWVVQISVFVGEVLDGDGQNPGVVSSLFRYFRRPASECGRLRVPSSLILPWETIITSNSSEEWLIRKNKMDPVALRKLFGILKILRLSGLWLFLLVDTEGVWAGIALTRRLCTNE